LSLFGICLASSSVYAGYSPVTSIDNGGNNFSAELDAYQRNVVYTKINYQSVGTSGGFPVFKYTGDIYLYQQGSGSSTITVRPTDADMRHPSIWGNRIVWQTSRNDPVNQNNLDIYLKEIGGSIYQLTTSSAKQTEPDIFGNYVVWLDGRNGGGNNFDVYLYDLSVDSDLDGIPNYKDGDRPNPDPALRRITTSPSVDNAGPKVYGHRVVWYQNASPNAKVYSYDLDTSASSLLASGISGQPRPSIYRDMVIWLENSGYDVYKYDFKSPGRTPVLTSAWPLTTPSLWGDNFAAEADNGSNDWDVRLYNLSGSQLWERTAGADTVFEKNPTLFGDPGAGTGLLAWAQDTIWPDSYDNNIKAVGISDSDVTSPTVPTAVLAADFGNGSLNISWTHSVSTDTAGYRLYWGTSSGNTTNSVDVYDVDSYKLKGLTNGQTYYTRLKAYDTSGNLSAGYSNESSATATNTPPETVITAPTGATTLTASPTLITGIATDTVAVNAVEVSFERSSDGYWWNGSAWVSGSQAWLNATITGGQNTPSATWQYSWDLPASNGNNYIIYAQAQDDTSAYDESPAQVEVAVDDVAPYTTVTNNPASPDGANGWYTTTPTIELSRSETGTTYWQWDSSAKPYANSSTGTTTTVTGISSGTHTLYYYSVDGAGNVESVKYKDYKLDTVTPATLLSSNPVSPDGDNGWYVTTPTITLAPDEAATTYYSWDSTASPATYSAPFTPPAGVHTLYYYSVDPAGNTEPAGQQIYKVDTTAPSTGLSSNPAAPDGSNGWYNTTTPTITLTPDESATTYYSWDSTASPATSTAPFTAPAGSHTLYYHSSDSAGNSETLKSRVFKVDTQAPATVLSASPSSPDGENGWYNTTTPTIELSRSETGTTYWQWDATTTPYAHSSVSATTTVTDISGGSHTLYYFSVDSAGSTEAVNNQLFKIDTGLPTDPTSVTSPSHTTGVWSNNNNITIDFSGAADAISGLDGYSVDFSQNTTATPDSVVDLPMTASSWSTSLAANGVWYLNLRTKDVAGNWTSTVHLGPFKIDTTAPTNPTAATELGGSPDNVFQDTNNNPDFTWSGAADSGGSGVAGYYYYFGTNSNGTASSWTAGAAYNPGAVSPGTYYLRVRTKDNAGNLSNTTTLFTFKYKNQAFTRALGWSSGLGAWNSANNKLAAGDFNHDGYQDIVSFYNYPANRQVKAWVWLNDGSGNYLAPQVWWDSGVGNWDWAGTKLAVGDYNGDNQDDMVVFYGYAAQRQTRAFVFTASGSGTFNAPVVWWDSGAGNWDWDGTKLQVGDFNGDGSDDLAAFYGYFVQRQTRAFVFTAGASTFHSPSVWWDSGPGNWDWAGTKLSSGDFDNDNKDDLLAFYGYFTQHQTRAFVFKAGAANIFNNPSIWWDSGAGNWDWSGTKLQVGDFDSNSGSDIAALYGYGGNQTRIFVFSANPSAARFNSPGMWWDSGPGNWSWSATTFLSGNASGDAALDELLGFYDQGANTGSIHRFE